MGKEIFTNDKYINDLFLKVVNLVTQARERVATAVNIAEVYTKFHIGQYIEEFYKLKYCSTVVYMVPRA